MRTWLALWLGLTLALASAVPAVAMEATTDEEGVYSAEAAMAEDGYTWDDAEGFFVLTDFVSTEAETPADEPKKEDTPKPRLDPNGCGPDWIKDKVPEGTGDSPGGFDFKEACNNHDRCYTTYPIPKDHTAETWRKKCDDDFEAAMNKYCDSVVGAKIADKYKITLTKEGIKWEKVGEIKWDDETARKHCKVWAKTYATLVRSEAGTKSFEKGQAEAKKKYEEDKKKEEKKDEPLEPAPGEPAPAEPAFEPTPVYSSEAQLGHQAFVLG